MQKSGSKYLAAHGCIVGSVLVLYFTYTVSVPLNFICSTAKIEFNFFATPEYTLEFINIRLKETL